MKENKTITIYSKWLVAELKEAGYKPLRTRPNNRKDGERIYYYDNVPGVKKILADYQKRYYQHRQTMN